MSGYFSEPNTLRRSLIPVSDNLFDLGSATKQIRSAYVGTSIIFGESAALIRSNTIDGSDDKVVSICGGGDNDTALGTRGAGIDLHGNEASGVGKVVIAAGNVSSSSHVNIATIHASAGIRIYNGNNLCWSFINGTLTQNGTNGSDIVFSKTLGLVRTDTSDGSDSKAFQFTGGGAILTDGSRGALLTLSGNEHSTYAGRAELYSGGTGTLDFGTFGGTIRFYPNNSSGLFLNSDKVLQLFNCVAAPSGTPSASGYIYCESGALKYKGSSGTVTTVAVA